VGFREIPSIEQLRQRPAVRALEARFGAAATLDALRAGAAAVRRELGAGGESRSDSGAADDVGARIERAASAALDGWFRPSLERVINATGVIIHTNLGRAPLAEPAIARVADVARGYASLEYDVARGDRGRRDVHADALLRRLTGAEAAVVVNNNAAATMIILSALAAGREVVVSRGELVEIGGGFRVPDVMAQSGAILREVGTTNKTRASDYAAAINEKTALILRVHPSNFRIVGFTERPTVADLVAVGKKCNIPVAEDLGSGHLSAAGTSGVRPRGDSAQREPRSPGVRPQPSENANKSDPLGSDPTVDTSINAGVDVCCFSGDKLLGGPQAGIIVGRAALVDRIRTHPLMRALRVDKMTYAALEATLSEYVAGRAGETVPVQRMLRTPAEALRPRAQALADQLNAGAGWRAELVAGSSAIGGGSAPGIELPTWLVAVEKTGLTADALDARLRRLTPPIVARIEHERLVIDLRTVSLDEDHQLFTLLRNVHTQG
jgi:L-seryl-tRNA(Ser) seleniumtransferase